MLVFLLVNSLAKYGPTGLNDICLPYKKDGYWPGTLFLIPVGEVIGCVTYISIFNRHVIHTCPSLSNSYKLCQKLVKLDTRAQSALLGKTYLFQLKVKTSSPYLDQIEK